MKDMGPLLLVAAGGAAALFFIHQKKAQAASGITPSLTGTVVKGKSGETWLSSIVTAGPPIITEITYQKGSVPAAPHMVIRYSQNGSDMNSRKLVATNPNTSAGLIQAAMADFGVSK